MSPLPLEDEIVTAEKLGNHPRTLQRWRREKINLPYVKVGNLVRYRPEDTEAFIQRSRVPVIGLDETA